jgi:hypothetical protein
MGAGAARSRVAAHRIIGWTGGVEVLAGNGDERRVP